MGLLHYYLVVDEDGNTVHAFTSFTPVNSADDVPDGVGRHLSPDTEYVVCYVGLLAPTVSLVTAADHDTSPETPVVPAAKTPAKSKS